MGDEPFQGDVGQLPQLLQKGGRVRIADSQPPHAGVDLEVDLCLAEQLPGGLIKGLGLFQGEDDGGKVEADALALLPG